MTEKELYPPVHDLFEKRGYKVNAEVVDCDMTAVKDDEFIIVELKKNLSVALLAQGLKRQRTGADVYVAVPKPKQYSFSKFRSVFSVIKKLELGLIFVSIRGGYSFAEIVFEPKPYTSNYKNYKKKKQIMDEINGRTIDTNTGGVTGTKIVTAYTEKCIHIACILDMYGEMSPKEVRAKGGADNTLQILSRNVYGWFRKVNKGIYAITDEGRKGLLEYPELEKYYTELLTEESPEE
ncbi:MAG: hypothetical protein J1F01_02740 [Oscillospiraceae bacterium]|nr:hypothetical protein [Oscillospiraceae bacterium]